MINEEFEGKLYNRLNYVFKDKTLLNRALTHSSYVNENRLAYSYSNERLEFLGDAILDATISKYLYDNNDDCEEGILTKERAAIVCESSLALCGAKLGLGEFLILSRGEENNGGRTRASMLADAVEAMLGAIFIDGGWEAAEKVTISILSDVIKEAAKGNLTRDYKTMFQEKLQAKGIIEINYIVEKEEGPAHNKMFYVNLVVRDTVIGKGTGKSKKEAEQKAAKAAYESGGDIVF